MSWTINAPYPTRFVRERDERVLNLSDREALVHARLYTNACDEWGRFIVSETSLRLATGLATGKPLVPVVKRLAALELVTLYPDGPRLLAQLVDYDDDLGARQREKRTTSKLAAPPGYEGGSEGGTHRGSQGGSELPPQVPTQGGSQGGGSLPPQVPPGVPRQVPPQVPPAASLSPSSPPTPPLSPTPPGEQRASHTARDPVPAPALLALESRAQDAVRLWLQHLAQVAPTHCIADDVVASVARDFTPAIFAAGVEAHIGDDPQWWRDRKSVV